jgi:phosphoglycerol transferase MdoB-like AlkP superfamily enzyme
MIRLSVAESLVLLWRWLKRLFILNIFFLFLMGVVRLITYWVYGHAFPFSKDILHAFILGGRFDSMSLAYVVSIPLLVLIAVTPLRSEKIFESVGAFLRGYYQIMGVLMFALLALDVAYYSYFQDHLNLMMFGFFEDDTTALLRTFWANYPLVWIFLISFVLGYLLCKIIARILKPFRHRQIFDQIGAWAYAPVFLVLILAVGLIGRGSLGLFPLGETDAIISPEPFINHLAGSGLSAFVRAVKLKYFRNQTWNANMKYYGYKDSRQAFADYFGIPVDQVPATPVDLFHHKTPKNEWAEKTKPNVVVVMMESLGGYWLKYNSPTFNLLGELDKHFKEDYLFRNFLPAATGTIGSISSLIVDSPQRTLGAFLSESEYERVPFRSSPAFIYKKAGYHTRLVYGGNTGWRDLNRFARNQGFDSVDGDVEISRALGGLKETHDWGVFDEDVFRYVKKTLDEAKEPELIVVLTTTNHPPYQLPSTYKVPQQTIPADLAARLNTESSIVTARFRVYEYAAEMLGRFMDEVKASPTLAEKTVVAITGDHSFYLINFSDAELLQKWSVPFYLYLPPSLKKSLKIDHVDTQVFGSHMDIFPTLFPLTLSETDYDALGVNLLDPSQPHYSVHETGLIAGPPGAALSLGKSGFSYLGWEGNLEKLVPAAATPERIQMSTRYRALMSLLDEYFHSEELRYKSENARNGK